MILPLFDHLTESQKKALESHGSLFVEAGAGSGKTTLLVSRFIQEFLSQPHLSPSQIVAITFTQKAAEEMKSRVVETVISDESSIPQSVKETLVKNVRLLRVSTIHGFCASLLKQFPAEMGLDPFFQILDQNQADLLWSHAMEETLLAHKKNQNSHLKNYLLHFSSSHLRNSLKTLFESRDIALPVLDFYLNKDFTEIPLPQRDYLSREETEITKEAFSLTQSLGFIFKEGMTAYQKIKKDSGKCDYHDLLTYTHQLLNSNPSVRESIRKGIRLLMVDEFQDTDPLQWKIFRLLVPDDENTLFLVGDIKQAIYNFRGAETALFLNVMADFQKCLNTKVIHLRDNFRSQKRLIDSINALFEKLFCSQSSFPIPYTPLECRRSEDSGRVEMTKLSKKASIEKEAECAAEWIQNHLQHYPERSFKDMVLLFRRKKSIAFFEKILAQYEIPSRIFGKERFYQNQEILDLIHLISACVLREDNLSWIGVLKSTLFGVSDEGLYTLYETSSKPSLVEKLKEFKSSWDSLRSENKKDKALLNTSDIPLLRDAAERISNWIRRTHWLSLTALVEMALRETGALSVYQSLDGGEEKIRNIKGFLKKLSQLEARFPHRLDILEFLKHAVASGASEPDTLGKDFEKNEVSLMTIHSAKGLEFPIVIVPECGQDFYIPSRDPLVVHSSGIGLSHKMDNTVKNGIRDHVLEAIRKETVEEEKRIFYVALTRARDHVFLIGRHEEQSQKISKNYFDFILSSEEGAPLNIQTFRSAVENEGDEKNKKEMAMTYKRRPEEGIECGKTEESPPNRSPIEIIKDDIPAPPFHRETLCPSPFIRLSVSDLVAFFRCPKHYFYSSLMTLSSFKRNNHIFDLHDWHFLNGLPPAAVGILIHRAIERVNTGYSHEISDQIQQMSTTAPLSSRTVSQLTREVEEHLERYRRSDLFEKIRNNVDCLHEYPFTVAIGRCVIEGRFDSVIPTKTGWEIVDYKTEHIENDAARTAKERFRTQMAIYCLALKAIKNLDYPLYHAHIYFTRIAKTVTLTFEKEEVDRWEETLLSVPKRIAQVEFTPPPLSVCQECPMYRYVPECPSQKIPRLG